RIAELRQRAQAAGSSEKEIQEQIDAITRPRPMQSGHESTMHGNNESRAAAYRNLEKRYATQIQLNLRPALLDTIKTLCMDRPSAEKNYAVHRYMLNNRGDYREVMQEVVLSALDHYWSDISKEISLFWCTARDT